MNAQIFASWLGGEGALRYLLLPMRNHLFARGGSSCSPELARVTATATTATTSNPKRMGKEGSGILEARKMGVGGGKGEWEENEVVAVVAPGVELPSSPVTTRVSLLPLPGGSTPAPSTQDLRISPTRCPMRIQQRGDRA